MTARRAGDGSCPLELRDEEAALLSTALSRDDVLDRLTLPPSAFVEPRNRVLYHAMRALRADGRPVDSVTVVSQLRAKGALAAAGGVEYVGELEGIIPGSIGSAEALQGHILDAYTRRRLVFVSDQISSAAERGGDVAQILADARERIDALARQGDAAFPDPLSIAAGLELDDAPDAWLFDGIVPLGGNVLQLGYPKSMKSIGYFDLAVSAALGQAWLRRFPADRQARVGIVLLEGRRRFAERMIQRLTIGRGASVHDLTGQLYLWHRPPLRLNDPKTLRGLGRQCAELGLDLVILDAFGYAAGPGTNTNSDQEVLDQLQAFSALRSYAPGLTTWLVHHARKETQDRAGTRLTDLVRGSGAFGQWFDAGVIFHRKDEQTPVTVRTEFRERAALKPFAFLAEDEHPAAAETGGVATGWFKLTATDRTAAQLEKDERSAAMIPKVLEFLAANPGAGVTQIRSGIEGDNNSISAAIDTLKRTNKIVAEAGGRGQKTRHYLSRGHRAEPC